MRLFSLILLLIDVLSKILAKSYIPSEGITLFQGVVSFSLDLAYNTGAAWGLFSHYPNMLFSLRLVILSALLFHLFFSQRKEMALWVLLAGALGNILDYLLYGHVIDFLHFRFWDYSFPIFNFADSYISCSLLFFLSFSKKKKNVDPKVSS